MTSAYSSADAVDTARSATVISELNKEKMRERKNDITIEFSDHALYI